MTSKNDQTASGTRSSSDSGLTSFGRWMALTAALLGWMFDGAEMGLFSLLGRSAVTDLLTEYDRTQAANGAVGAAAATVDAKQADQTATHTADKPVDEEAAKKEKAKREARVGFWFGVIIAVFLVGAATGGVLFGWLGDRIGRVRAMSLSVITYALFTGACGLVTSPWQLAILRFIASLGMGGEWALGVALVMEVWPNRSRALMAGLIGAAANFGYLLVGFIGLGLSAILHHLHDGIVAIGISAPTADWLTGHQGWRIMMLLGTAPALLTFFFRMFVPESGRWLHQREEGVTSQWQSRDLLGVLIGGLGPALIVTVWAAPYPAEWNPSLVASTRIIGTLIGLVVVTAGYTYPAYMFLKRTVGGLANEGSYEAGEVSRTVRRMWLAAGLAGVALLGTWGSTQWSSAWAAQLSNNMAGAREWTQIASSSGAIIGTILAALCGDWLGRRWTYFLLCGLSMGSALLFFQSNTEYSSQFLVTAFLAGMCTASFYGWLPLYLPELFRTSVRATGQGFGFNFGRILAAIGALQTGALMGLFKDGATWNGIHFTGGYPLACSTMSMVYFLGMGLIWLAPETRGQPLPE